MQKKIEKLSIKNAIKNLGGGSVFMHASGVTKTLPTYAFRKNGGWLKTE